MLQYNPFFPISFELSDFISFFPTWNGSFQLITLELKSFQLNNSIELDFPTIRTPVKCLTAF